MSISKLFWLNKGRICLKFFRVANEDLDTLWMCSVKERSESNITPKFLTEDEIGIIESLSLIDWRSDFASSTLLGVPTSRISVLLGLIFRKF